MPPIRTRSSQDSACPISPVTDSATRVATWMADAGVPVHVLQEILEHASMETTRGYVHPDDWHLASAAEQANAFLSASGQRRQASRGSASTRGL
ncbi:tyrosine-type recombinase/integrase [Microbacterium sp. Leaf179]|uniref:tyrosine-type recombinase/integrase n=1 Tax=Microbacterium sp. Leaf179 TaxID=1736288 RepID=UPI002E0FAE86